MRICSIISKPFLLLVQVAFLMACQSPSSFPNSIEYLKAKGFDHALFAQVRVGDTVKNINDQLPILLEVLHNSKMIPKKAVDTVYTISLETGSSLPSQTVSIFVGIDGYGVINFKRKRAYFHCPELPTFAASTFQKSAIIVR
jgi:hypothetical protein